MTRKIALIIGLCLVLKNVWAKPIQVAVTIAPYAQFVEAVGKTHVKVTTLVPAGSDPELYEPATQTFIDLSHAQVYFMSGLLPFELTMQPQIRSVNPKLKLINLSKQVVIQNNDPHIWIAPDMVILQVKAISATLSQLDPAHSVEFQQNATAYIDKITTLDSQFKKKLSTKKNRKFLTIHPSFSYLAKSYQLEQLALETEGKSPHPRHIQTVTKKAKGLRYLISQKQVSPSLATSFAQSLHLKIIEVDPLAKDYLKSTELLFNALLNALDTTTP